MIQRQNWLLQSNAHYSLLCSPLSRLPNSAHQCIVTDWTYNMTAHFVAEHSEQARNLCDHAANKVPDMSSLSTNFSAAKCAVRLQVKPVKIS